VDLTNSSGDAEGASAAFRHGVEAAFRLPLIGKTRLCAGLADEWTWAALLGRLVSQAVTDVAGTIDGSDPLDELQLGPVIAGLFGDLGLDEGAAWRLVGLIRMLRQMPLPSSVSELAAGRRPATLVRALIADETVRPYIRVNVWEDVTYFNRESFDQVLWWMVALDALAAASDPTATEAAVAKRLREAERLTAALAKAAEASGYQLDKLEAAAAGA